MSQQELVGRPFRFHVDASDALAKLRAFRVALNQLRRSVRYQEQEGTKGRLETKGKLLHLNGQ